MAEPLQPGAQAPDFSLPVSRDQKVSLNDYKGQKNVILSFHVFDFTGNDEAG